MTSLAFTPAYLSSTSTQPLDLALAGFLSRYKGQTFRSHELNMRVFLRWCWSNGLDPLAAKRPHIELYIRWLETQGWADSTVSLRACCVCLFYKYTALDDLISKDPTIGVNRPRIDRNKQKRTYLTSLEMAQFMQAAKKESATAVTLGTLLGYCGLRISEATSLNIEDIRQEQGWDVISFIGKGNKLATIPIPVPVMRAIKESNGTRTSGPILRNNRQNRMTRSNATTLIRKVARTANISSQISPHSFRRTMVSTLLQQGVSIYEVQKAARHASPEMTMVYDRSANSLDRNVTHLAAAFYAAMTA